MNASEKLYKYLDYRGYHWGYSIKYIKLWYRRDDEEKFIRLSNDKHGNALLNELFFHYAHYINE